MIDTSVTSLTLPAAISVNGVSVNSGLVNCQAINRDASIYHMYNMHVIRTMSMLHVLHACHMYYMYLT